MRREFVRKSPLHKRMSLAGHSLIEGIREGHMVEKTFKEKYIAGEVEFEEIDDYSQEWGLHDDSMTLREYLGLNAEEEDVWISVSDEALKELLDKQRIQ